MIGLIGDPFTILSDERSDTVIIMEVLEEIHCHSSDSFGHCS